MKTILRRYLLIGLLPALVLTGLVLAFRSSAAPPAASAHGQGTLMSEVEGEPGVFVKRHFSVNARQGANGTATGKAVLHNPAFPGENGHAYQAHIDIRCMHIVDNTAIIGGFVRKTNDPNLIDAVFFTVQDNGEPGAGNDRISRAYFNDDIPGSDGDPMACLTLGPDDLPLEEIESGNIQVRP
jgi:hypothetical protein